MKPPKDLSALSTAGGLADAGQAFAAEHRWAEAIAAFERSLTLDPSNGIAYGALGYCYERSERHADAASAYERAAALVPDSLALVFNLGNSLRTLGRLDEAVRAYLRALGLDPSHALSWNNLGLVRHAQSLPDEAIACYARALELRPGYADAVNNLGTARLAKGDLPSALEAYRAALLLDPNQRKIRFNLGVALLLAGDYEAGWAGFELRERPPYLASLSGPFWDGADPLAGQVIVLAFEQGFGDTIHFVRYATTVAETGAEVHLLVQPAMKRLLSRVRGVTSVVATGEPLPAHDTHSTFLSLPYAFGTVLETVPAVVPYLWAPPGLAEAWRERLRGPRPVVGLAWSGNPGHHLDHHRSIALERVMHALGGIPARFVSLQRDVRPTDEAALASPGAPADYRASIHDFADTAALISQVDLVISVDTSVAHLAGALGKPVWILLPFAPDFRWMRDRSDSPWYPTARLFRQPRPLDWEPVLVSVREALRAWMEAQGSGRLVED